MGLTQTQKLTLPLLKLPPPALGLDIYVSASTPQKGQRFEKNDCMAWHCELELVPIKMSTAVLQSLTSLHKLRTWFYILPHMTSIAANKLSHLTFSTFVLIPSYSCVRLEKYNWNHFQIDLLKLCHIFLLAAVFIYPCLGNVYRKAFSLQW